MAAPNVAVRPQATRIGDLESASRWDGASWLSCSSVAPWGVHDRLVAGVCSRCGWSASRVSTFVHSPDNAVVAAER